MHQIKPELRRQDLPSFKFSWKKLCRVDIFVFESWQTAVKSQGKTIMSSAVCHDSKTKKSTRQSFFNFMAPDSRGIDRGSCHKCHKCEEFCFEKANGGNI
jgi:NAD-dependent dihydropyrimidine dehydrogenase PreA subunit